MIKYPYNEDSVSLALSKMQREDLERLIHSGMQFTANVVGLTTDNMQQGDLQTGAAISAYLEEQGML